MTNLVLTYDNILYDSYWLENIWFILRKRQSIISKFFDKICSYKFIDDGQLDYDGIGAKWTRDFCDRLFAYSNSSDERFIC